MERVCQNIYQIYQKSKNTKSLIQNLKSNSFYIGDFLQKYDFVKEIGKGGHDNILVKLYTEKNGHKNYAIKSYEYHIEQDKTDLEEFIIEAYTQEKIQNKVDCPYINNMKGFFIEINDDMIYLNMILEYGDGNLNQLINHFIKNKDQKLDFSQLIKIFQQLLTVLKVCKENQITHRDIKPSNIIYRQDFQNYTVQLADFGEASKNQNLKQTRNTTIRGTPQYLSSELLYAYIKKEVYDDVYNPYKSDTYSLGLSILSLASCNNYFNRNTENMIDPSKYDKKDIGQEDWKYLKLNEMFDKFKLKYKEQSSQNQQNFIDIIEMCLCYNPKYRNTSQEILNQLNIKFYQIQPQNQKYEDQNIKVDIQHNQIYHKTLQYQNGQNYQGDFKNDKKHGQDTIYYQNGNIKYQGDFKDGKFNGQGTCYYQNGEKYEGDWKDDKKHGSGTIYYQNGNIQYQGDFKDDQFNGQGTYYYQNGEKFIGYWKDDKKHYSGTIYYQNGEKYEGNWKDDKKHSAGTIYYQDGNKKYQGDFKDDQFNGQGTCYYQNGNIKYQGDFKDGKFNGQGTCYYQNGEKYEGNWKDYKKHGSGTYYYQNGSIKYQGDFKDGKFNGQGTIYYQNDEKYIGNWKDDKKHGSGTIYYQNGDKYIGNWKDDKKHGQGTYYYQNGKKDEGEWKDDNLNDQDGQCVIF